jgi:hypothetical protein
VYPDFSELGEEATTAAAMSSSTSSFALEREDDGFLSAIVHLVATASSSQEVVVVWERTACGVCSQNETVEQRFALITSIPLEAQVGSLCLM